MRMFSWRFYRLWQRNRDVFFRLWHSEGAGAIIEPVLVLLAFGMGMGAFIGDTADLGGQRYIEFLAPGIIVAYAMFAASFECTYGTFIRMEYQRTHDAILATPLNIEDVTAGEIFWGATRSLLTSSVILAIAAGFHVVTSPWAALVPAVSFLTGIMFSAIGVLYSSLAPSIYSFNYYFSLFITPVFFFSGVFFPLSSFPEIVQRLSWIAPLTPAVQLTRALVNGNLSTDLLLALAYIVGLSAIFFSVSLVTMRRRLIV